MAGIGCMGLVTFPYVVLALLVSTTSNGAGTAQEPLLLPVDYNEKMPSIELSNLHGQPSRLQLLPGKINIIHFWATWCAPCREELPALITLARQAQFSNINIVAVAADSHKAVKQFSDSQALPGNVLIDQYGKAMNTYHIRALPSSYITDLSTNIKYQVTGKLDWNSPATKKILQQLINQP